MATTPTTPDPAGTPAPTEQPDGDLGLDLQSSRQLAQAGIEVSDYKAKYDGVVGSTKQLITKFNAKLAEKEVEIVRLGDQVSGLNTQLAALKPQADSVTALQTQLETVQAEHAKVTATSQRQSVLLKYPTLLAPTKDGKSSPLLDVLLASSLPLDQFEAKAAELASLNFGAQVLPAGGPPVPPNPVTGTDTPEAWREKANEAHRKFITSGLKDKEAEQAEADAWKKVRELETAARK